MAQLVAALKGRLLTASPRATTSLASSAFRSARAYSRKTKTRYEVEASELKSDIAKLQKAIADQERQLAAKKAYEESILRQNERINAASTVYRELMKPQAPPAPSTPSLTAGTPTARLPDNPNAKSFLPGTFLEDLRLTFLDTRGAKEEKLRQLQSGLLSMEDLKAITPDSVHAPSETTTSTTHLPGTLSEAGAMVGEMAVSTELEAKVEDAVVFERVRALDVTQWNNLVYVNALEGRPDKAEQVLKLMEEVGVSPTVETFDHLLEAYANHGDLAKAQGTIDLIIKNGLTPSLSSYNSLISIHVAQRDLMGAFRTFDALKQHHAPDTAVFTNLVKGCLLAEEYDLGWKIFDQMQHSGAPPDESTYSMMIRACAKTDQVERALDIFRQYPTRRLHPTDKTFNSLIHACAVRKEYFTTAFALLNEMQNVYGFEPDILTYNTLLFACSKRQDLMTARRIFQKVVQLDHEGHLELDGITVTNFLWCVTEWKNTDLHHKRYKYRVRNERNKRLEEAAGKQEDVTAAAAASSTLPLTSNPTTTTDTLAIRSDYLLLSKIPPMDEMEALAEGEKVFSWFIARAAERHPPPPPKTLESQPPSPTEHGDPATSDPSSTTTNSSDATTLTTTTATTTTARKSANPTTEDILRRLPRIDRAHTPIRTRLLNAYLAMYVRHNEIPTAKDIYNRFFRHFQQPRDSWTFATMLEGCYFWKDVDFGSQVFRDWRAWRLSTGKVTEKRYRRADYDVYRRTVNLLARTNHLREALALLEELSKTATGEGGGILALQAKEAEQEDHHNKADDQVVEAVDAMPRDKELEDLFDTSTSSLDHPSTSSSSSTPTSSSSSSSPAAPTSLSSTTASKFSFLTQVDDATVLPIYPRLQDFPAVYTKTWELEDEPARRYLLSLCSGGIETLNPGRGDKDKNKEKERADNKDDQPATAAAAAEAMGKRRHDKSLRKLALRWKGEHHHPDDRRGGGLYIGERRRRELEQDTSKRGWGRK